MPNQQPGIEPHAWQGNEPCEAEGGAVGQPQCENEKVLIRFTAKNEELYKISSSMAKNWISVELFILTNRDQPEGNGKAKYDLKQIF